MVEQTPQGELILWVNGPGLIPDDSIILIDGRPCRRYYYPERFFQTDGTTTRIGCSGKIGKRLPGTITVLNVSTGCLIGGPLLCQASEMRLSRNR